MKTLPYCLLLLAVLSCKKTDADTVIPEYADWYTIKAPIDRAIEGVWGNRDKTLLITTSYQIFRSTDQGNNWQQVYQQRSGMFGVVQYRDTLFTMNGMSNGQQGQVLVNAGNYSVDDGKTWQRYTKPNPALQVPLWGQAEKQLQINPVTASNGVSYKINQVFLDGPTATTGTSRDPRRHNCHRSAYRPAATSPTEQLVLR